MKNIFWDDLLDVPTFIGFISIIIVIIAIFMVIINYFASYSCAKVTKIMELDSQYSFTTQCMVKIDGKWQPFNEYNTVNIK